jgi:hypothetical protein
MPCLPCWHRSPLGQTPPTPHPHTSAHPALHLHLQLEVKGRLALGKLEHFLGELRHSRSRTGTPAPQRRPQPSAPPTAWLPGSLSAARLSCTGPRFPAPLLQ